MRRFALAAGLLTFGMATPATAQGFVGAGITTPIGEYGNDAKLGWAVNVGFRPYQSADERMSLWLEGLYGQNNYKGTVDGKFTTLGGFGSLTYNLTTGSSTTPYVIGSLGYITRKMDGADASGALGYGGGGGVGFGKLYVEARYLSWRKDSRSYSFVLWSVGYTF